MTEQAIFKGYLGQFSKENELRAWQYITKVIEGALSLYSTTLEEDQQILKKDQQENHLSINERNCILYRKGEKAILHYVKDCALKVEKMVKMTKDQAKLLDLWGENALNCPKYFKDTLFSLL